MSERSLLELLVKPFALSVLVSLLAAAGPAAAWDERPPAESGSAGQASVESAEAVGALAEVGLKAVAGVVAAPVAVAGLASGAAGGGSVAVGGSVAAAGSAAVEGASAAANFASSPLSVSDEVIVKAQPAPAVPFDAQAPR